MGSRTEGIEVNANRGMATTTDNVGLLIRLSARAAAKKTKNAKQNRKIQIKMADKVYFEHQKQLEAEFYENLAREGAFWAPSDKQDTKFQQKQQSKLTPQGPSKKALKRMLEEEDDIIHGVSKAVKTNSAWKRRA